MLLITYTWITLVFALAISVYPAWRLFDHIVLEKNYKDYRALFEAVCLLVAVVMVMILFVTITMFIKYHLGLISNNVTTLESLEE